MFQTLLSSIFKGSNLTGLYLISDFSLAAVGSLRRGLVWTIFAILYGEQPDKALLHLVVLCSWMDHSLDLISLAASSFNTFLRIFPLAFFGIASTKCTPPLNPLYLASRSVI